MPEHAMSTEMLSTAWPTTSSILKETAVLTRLTSVSPLTQQTPTSARNVFLAMDSLQTIEPATPVLLCLLLVLNAQGLTLQMFLLPVLNMLLVQTLD